MAKWSKESNLLALVSIFLPAAIALLKDLL